MMTMKTADSPSRSATSVSFGAELTFESFSGEDAPLRVRPREQTLLRIIDGIVRLAIDGQERLLGVGDEVVIAPGVPHRLSSACGEAHVMAGYRRARAA
jgi:mannose-6-phosphate isomerase-like protein (cupin superfamily)